MRPADMIGRMRRVGFEASRRQGLAWLAALLLLLPLSQAASAWHAISHLGRGHVESSDEGASAPDEPCLQCLAAAPLDHAGPSGSVAAGPLPEASRGDIAVAAAFTRPAEPAAAYLSRGPPPSPR